MVRELLSSYPGEYARENAAAAGIELGIEWCTVWSPLGFGLNGYISIPKGHLLHGVLYNDDDWQGIDGHVYLPGGCTFSQEGTEPGSWWIGYDTAHYNDYWPGSFLATRPGPGMHAWSFEHVEEVTKLIARQVAYDPGASFLLDTYLDRITIK